MKKLIVLALLALPLAVHAQITGIYAAGASYAPGAQQPLAVTGFASHAVSSDTTGTQAFVVADAIPTSTKPLVVSTNIGTGIAQKAVTIGKVDIYIPTSAGISWTGKNTGWQWSSGAMAPIPFKGFLIMPNVRFLKSSVSNGSDYQVIFGVLFGLGKKN